jgi:hypothetical protein
MYIVNARGDIKLPYDPDLLKWLNENYPYSKYSIQA